jgi:Isocitrate/isopropylmalate dehydrogenase
MIKHYNPFVKLNEICRDYMNLSTEVHQILLARELPIPLVSYSFISILNTHKKNKGTILSIAMLLELSLGLPTEAQLIRDAVKQTLDDGHRTADMVKSGSLNTRAITDIPLPSPIVEHNFPSTSPFSSSLLFWV